MIFTLVFLILIIFLFVEIFRYIKVKANAFSRTEVKRAAQEQVQKIRYKDPVISCDYCGSKIDTRKHRVCPGCGASYYRDEEWTSRHEVSEGRMDKISGKMMTNL